MAVPIKHKHKNGNYNHLATRWKQNSPWNCENLRSRRGHFANETWTNLQSKVGAGCVISHLCQICFLCYKIYAFQRVNTSKMTQTDGLLLLAQPVQS